MTGTFNSKKFIEDAKRIGINENIIVMFLSFTITEEQNGMRLFRVLSNNPEITVTLLRHDLSEFLEKNQALSQKLLEMVMLRKSENKAGIKMVLVEEGADTSEYTGNAKQIVNRTEFPQGSSTGDMENINMMRKNNYKAIQESNMSVNMIAFASGSKPKGNFSVSQIADEVVVTNQPYQTQQSSLQLAIQQQTRDGLLNTKVKTSSQPGAVDSKKMESDMSHEESSRDLPSQSGSTNMTFFGQGAAPNIPPGTNMQQIGIQKIFLMVSKSSGSSNDSLVTSLKQANILTDDIKNLGSDFQADNNQQTMISSVYADQKAKQQTKEITILSQLKKDYAADNNLPKLDTFIMSEGKSEDNRRTSRRQLLNEIAQSFATYKEAVLTDAHYKALQGFGGVGKTMLALKYAEIHIKDYKVIGWIPADKPIQESFETFVKQTFDFTVIGIASESINFIEIAYQCLSKVSAP